MKKVDTKKPHWRCKCGTVAMPLEDSTRCKCNDIYEQEWRYIKPRKAALKAGEKGLTETDR